ncbi:MAG: hypothetical protein A2161_09785 [Candidatus Schekmanbacteria bacterium RBG_13_48_7]|uniref:Fis family transcriptional regulator n=1 Tax=Candidatus Schekmanbacteria bacterium RBG_13_48_7 TaxID=1817878 RepID=A0A1F7RLS5_9BACT|nr:MAG: hypothetical protein A2161_09785 [Candidatus Schekmanbacteria bacterium RBG_13_48_7]
MKQISIGKILIVDDERNIRELLTIILNKANFDAVSTDDGHKALDIIQTDRIDLVIQDLRMPKMDGIQLLKKIKDSFPRLPVVVITAFSSWDTAVEAMRLGAFDYIKKPFKNESIIDLATRAIEQSKLLADLTQEGFGDRYRINSLIGNHPKMQEIQNLIRKIAPTDATILIQGESGTGKELVARAIHFCSSRARQPFIAVNCGAFTETLLESELFGHKKGSFTGAIADKKGLFEAAEKGTVFLDEIGEMSQKMQVKLLRLLEEREFMPVGSLESKHVDIRIISATKRDLSKEIANNRFREDLFYRLNVIPILLPPLNERKEDIPLLAGYFLAKYSKTFGKDVRVIDKYVINNLIHHTWPGNVRELENLIQRAVALSDDETIRSVDLLQFSFDKTVSATQKDELPPEGIELEDFIATIEKNYILQALQRTNWHFTKAAKLLGLTFRSLRYKINKYQIK